MFFYVRLNGRIVGRVVAAAESEALALARRKYSTSMWGDVIEVLARRKQKARSLWCG